MEWFGRHKKTIRKKKKGTTNKLRLQTFTTTQKNNKRNETK